MRDGRLGVDLHLLAPPARGARRTADAHLRLRRRDGRHLGRQVADRHIPRRVSRRLRAQCRASDLIQDLYRLEELPVAQPQDIKRAIAASVPAIERALGAGGGRILNRFTVSAGVIAGGIKINMLPGYCRLEVDIRLPVCTTHAGLLREIEAIVALYPEVKLQPIWTHSAEPTLSHPGHPMMKILKATVKSL